MVPELKFSVDFPGFGSLELGGESIGKENNFHEVSIKFIPSNSGIEHGGLVIKICRNGNCFVQELKPVISEDIFDGVGIA